MRNWNPLIYYLLGLMSVAFTIALTGCALPHDRPIRMRFNSDIYSCDIDQEQWKRIHRGEITLAISGSNCIFYMNGDEHG